MKVILSRKGFDSGYGGYPSIIMPDGEMITIPIPSGKEDYYTYTDIHLKNGHILYDLMKQLNKNIKSGTTQELTPDIHCHLDPDLCEYSVIRENNWRGAFGQISAAQKVLENNDIKPGDIFIFFGWFNDVVETSKGYQFARGKDRHTIFGYLQIDKIIHPAVDEVPNWLKNHPRARAISRVKKDSNCIYIARETCTFNKNIKGYGMFQYNEELDLTKKGMTRTCWELPDFFKKVNITYHNENSWKDGYFKSACRGQEFVIEENKEIEKWAISLIEKYSTNKVKQKVKI